MNLFGSTNKTIEIPIPQDFIYGNLLYLRGVLIENNNFFEDLDFSITQNIGTTFPYWNWNLKLKRYDSDRGPAYLLNILIKPILSHKYTLELSIPTAPGTSPLKLKLEYRSISKEAWLAANPNIKIYLEENLISLQNKNLKNPSRLNKLIIST